MVNEKSSAVGVNIQEKATMIWNVADVLRGPFKPHEYGLVILPMTVVKRFHDCLLPTYQAVLDTYEKVKMAVSIGLTVDEYADAKRHFRRAWSVGTKKTHVFRSLLYLKWQWKRKSPLIVLCCALALIGLCVTIRFPQRQERIVYLSGEEALCQEIEADSQMNQVWGQHRLSHQLPRP